MEFHWKDLIRDIRDIRVQNLSISIFPDTGSAVQNAQIPRIENHSVNREIRDIRVKKS